MSGHRCLIARDAVEDPNRRLDVVPGMMGQTPQGLDRAVIRSGGRMVRGMRFPDFVDVQVGCMACGPASGCGTIDVAGAAPPN